MGSHMTVVIPIIKKSLCLLFDFEELGPDEYLVHTNMYFDDGDEFHIIMTQSADGFTLTDESHTMMWLSNEDFRFTENRRKILDRIIEQNDVELVDGEILTSVDSPEKVGQALFSMIRAIMKISDLRSLERSLS